MDHSPLLTPVVVLILWSFVMLAWLYATRLPPVFAGKVVYDASKPASAFHEQYPPSTRWKSDNYTHLMEQPTLFYAVTLTLVFLGAGGGLEVSLAWAYVGLRIVHSLVQATVNVVQVRFLLFIASSLVLLAMALRAAFLLF
jgi:hypothetical protein